MTDTNATFEIRFVEEDECYRIVNSESGIAEHGDYETEADASDAIDKKRAVLIQDAIEYIEATTEEKDGLLEVFGMEGFGGREEAAVNRASARAIVEERLDWFRAVRAPQVKYGVAKLTATTQYFLDTCPAVKEWTKLQVSPSDVEAIGGDDWVTFSYNPRIEVPVVPQHVEFLGCDTREEAEAY